MGLFDFLNSALSFDTGIKGEKINCLPFEFNSKTYTDCKFSYIPIENDNIKIVNYVIDEINILIHPFSSKISKCKLGYDYEKGIVISNHHYSQIRYNLTTESGKQAKYTTCLFLGYYDKIYGSKGTSLIYFNNNGEIGKADVSFIYKKSSFQISIREKNNELYVRKITKTIYEEPYGTTTIYLDNERS